MSGRRQPWVLGAPDEAGQSELATWARALGCPLPKPPKRKAPAEEPVVIALQGDIPAGAPYSPPIWEGLR